MIYGYAKVGIPELNNEILWVFRKSKWVRIKFQEIRHESVLIGGVTAGVKR